MPKRKDQTEDPKRSSFWSTPQESPVMETIRKVATRKTYPGKKAYEKKINKIYDRRVAKGLLGE